MCSQILAARGSSFVQHDSGAYVWDVRQVADAILNFVAGIDLKTYAETQET